MKIDSLLKVYPTKLTDEKPIEVKKIIKVYNNHCLVIQTERKGTLFDTYG